MQQKTTPLISQGWQRALAFFIILVLANFALYYFLYTDDADEAFFLSIPGLTMNMGLIVSAALVTMILVYIFCRLVDKIPITALGTAFHIKDAVSGFFLAASLAGAGSMILVLSGTLQWMDWNFNANRFFVSILLLFVVAFSEELAFRGYILSNLLQSLPRNVAIAITAGAFALMHAANPGMEVIPIINLLLGGIILGQCYTIDHNIWMPATFHFAWNFVQGPVLGFRVSGLELPSVLEQQLSGTEWLTGGQFGFEGSIAATVVLLTGVVIMEIRNSRSVTAAKVTHSNSKHLF